MSQSSLKSRLSAFFLLAFLPAASFADYNAGSCDHQSRDVNERIKCQEFQNKLCGSSPCALPNLGITVTAASVSDDLEKYCSSHKTKAMKCCSGLAPSDDGSCPLATDSAKQARRTFQGIRAAGDDACTSTQKLQQLSSTGATTFAATAGLCEAEKFLCSRECGEVIRQLTGKSEAWATTALATAKAAKSACAGVRNEGQDNRVSLGGSESEAKRIAGLSCGTSSDPQSRDGGASDGGTTAAGDPGASDGSGETKSGSGSSGFGQMAAQLAPALLQMLMTPKEEAPQMAEIPCDGSEASMYYAHCFGQGTAKVNDSLNKGNNAEAEMQLASAEDTDGEFTGFGSVGDNQAVGYTGSGQAPGEQQTPTVGTVANNTGGGIPGTGGGGAASLGGGGTGGGAGAAGPKIDANGFSSPGGGGGASGLAAMNERFKMQGGEGGGGYNYNRGSGLDDGFKLADYLPNGRAFAGDTGRNVAGVGGGNFQIQSKDVNIWNRISERIRARCSQGLLKDCIP